MMFFSRTRTSQRSQSDTHTTQQEQTGSQAAVLDEPEPQAAQMESGVTRKPARAREQGVFTVDLMDDWCKP